MGALPALALCETLPRSPLPPICGSSPHAPSTVLCKGSVVVMLPPPPPPVGGGPRAKLWGQALLSSCGAQTPSLQCDVDALLGCVVPPQHTHTISRATQPCPAQVLLLLHAVRWCHLRHRPAPTHRPHCPEHGRVRGPTCLRRRVPTRDPRTRRLYTQSYSHTHSHTPPAHTYALTLTHRLHTHTHSHTHTTCTHIRTHTHTPPAHAYALAHSCSHVHSSLLAHAWTRTHAERTPKHPLTSDRDPSHNHRTVPGWAYHM